MKALVFIFRVLGFYVLFTIVVQGIIGFAQLILDFVVDAVRLVKTNRSNNKKAKGAGLDKKLYEKIQAGDYIYAKGEVVS